MADGKNQQQDPASVTNTNFNFDGGDTVQSLATEQTTVLPLAKSRTKSKLSEANTASYAGHTQASIARQTDKVELDPSRPPATRLASITDFREPPASLDVAQQQKVVEPGNRSRVASYLSLRPRLDRRGISVAPLWTSSRPETCDGSAGSIDGYTPSLEESRGDQGDENSPNDSPLGGSHLRDCEDEASIGKLQEYYDLSVPNTPGNERKFEIEDGGGVGIKQLDAQNSEAHAPRVRIDTVKGGQTPISEEQENVPRHTGSNLLESGAIDGEESAVERDIDAKKMVDALKDENQALDQDAKVRTTDNREAKRSSSSYNDKLARLRKDIELLTEAIETPPLDNAASTLDTKTLKELHWDVNYSPEVRNLHQSFTKLTEQLGAKVQTVSDQNRDHQAALAEKEIELAKANKELQATRELERAPDRCLADREGWKKRYNSERRKRNQAELKFPDFRKKAEARYRFDLDKLRREFQAELNDARDQNVHLEERAQTLRTRAQRWEGEYRTMRSRAEKEYAESEDTVTLHQDEMLRCVKEYRDKVKDQGHWEVRSLQERVLALERDQELTNEEFNQAKKEKACMEETHVPQLQNIIEANEEETKELKDAWANQVLARAAHTQGPAIATFGKCMFLETTTEHPTASSPVRHEKSDTKTQYVPHCLHPDETAKREAEVSQLRAKQEERENWRQGSEEIMKKVRKWKIGDELFDKKGWKFGIELYNRQGWKQYKGQGSWDTWDGYGWYSKQDENMQSIIDKLGEEGFLH